MSLVKVGKGACGYVYDIEMHGKTGVVKRCVMRNREGISNISEVVISHMLSGSPYIIENYGIIPLSTIKRRMDPLPDKRVDSQFHIYMERGVCDLHTFIFKSNIPNDIILHHLLNIFYCIGCSLCQLKHTGILHRDIKISNFIVFIQFCEGCYWKTKKKVSICKRCVVSAKLIDFGHSCIASHIHNSGMLTVDVYRSPESISYNYTSFPHDVWGLATAMFLSFFGTDFVDCEDKTKDLIEEILKVRLSSETDAEISNWIDENFIDENQINRYKAILNNDRKIPQNEELINSLGKNVHDKVIDLLSRCFTMSFDKRITPEEFIKHPLFLGCEQHLEIVDVVIGDSISEIPDSKVWRSCKSYFKKLCKITTSRCSKMTMQILIRAIQLCFLCIDVGIVSTKQREISINNMELLSMKPKYCVYACSYIAYKITKVTNSGLCSDVIGRSVCEKSIYNAELTMLFALGKSLLFHPLYEYIEEPERDTVDRLLS